MPLEKIFTKIEQKFFNISEKKTINHLISVEQGLKQILQQIEKGLKIPQTPGLKTTFIEFDIITQGFHNSDLIIIAARPSMGCLLYTSPSPRDLSTSRMPSSA